MPCKNILPAALLCLILPITGCTIMRAESNKDPDYTANIHRLAVVGQLGPVSFQDSFNKNLTDMMRSCGAQVTFVNLAQIAADPTKSVLKKDAGGNGYDALLTIEMTSYQQLTRYGAPVGNPDNFHYTLTLRDPAGKKVWKSLMVFAAGNVVLGDKGQIFAGDIIKQMNKDGIFAGCMPLDSETSNL